MDSQEMSYEEDILRNPYSFKTWWYYLDLKAEAAPEVRNVIFERALKVLPRSYKLWYKYLLERKTQLKNLCITDVAYEEVNNCFERAIVHMHKMPKIWSEYLHHLTKQKFITRTRHAFDRALRALPITQHSRWIWPSYLKFVKSCKVGPTAVRVYRRYLMLHPDDVEDFVEFLLESNTVDEAARHLAELVNDDQFVSSRGKSKHDLWTQLLTLITKNPHEVKSLDVDAVIRSGIKRYAHEVGNLYNALADYYIRLGLFEKARDVYEEGITSVHTVRDFTLIFDAYTKYEESLLTAKMEALNDDNMDEEDSDSDDEQTDIDLRLLRLDHLVDRRALLLSDVLLRQNPHNVQEWMKRVALFKEDPVQAIRAYTQAVTTVDPQKATGKPHLLWISFARFYERHGDLDNARVIFQKAVEVNYKSVDALASVWCAYGEMELKNYCYDKALTLLKHALVVPKGGLNNYKSRLDKLPVQKKVFKSTRLWTFYVDLEENLGTLQSTKAAYEQMVKLEVATPQTVIAYAQYMEENKYFEDSFRVYEKGIELFDYPHVYPIWLCYLRKFIARYEGTKIERTRDLFEQAVSNVPAKHAHVLFLLYAKFEEDHGLARRAMLVYDRCCNALEPKDKAKLFSIYINRCAEFFGVTKTREIYERALKELPDQHMLPMCVRYAGLERKLGEIDRARLIYTFAAQFADTKANAEFWKLWHDFEVHFGNKQTFREMLRVSHSVEAQRSQMNMTNVTPSQPPAEEEGGIGSLSGNKRQRDEAGNAMAGLEQKGGQELSAARKRAMLEEAEHAAREAREEAEKAQELADVNMDEAGLKEAELETIKVPDAVFGTAESASSSLGALERMKKARS